MWHRDGVEVSIVSSESGEVFEEYMRPGTDTKLKTERYVEATNNEQFYVRVKTSPSFKFYSASGLEVSWGFSSETGGCIWVDKPESRHATEGTELKIDYMTCRVDNEWTDCYLAFGNVQIDKDAHLSAIGLDAQASNMGQIFVTVQRSHREVFGEPKFWEMQQSYVAEERAAAQLVKDRGISHYIKPAQTQTTEPPVIEWEATPLEGVKGEELEFVFHYRSHMSLQRLGLTPFDAVIDPAVNRTSSDLTEESDQQDTAVEQAPRPLDSAAAVQIGQPIADTAPSDATLLPNTAVSSQPIAPAATSIKREFTTERAQTLSAMPSAKRVKTIDLTLDDPPEPPMRSFKMETKHEQPLVPLGNIFISNSGDNQEAKLPTIKHELATDGGALPEPSRNGLAAVSGNYDLNEDDLQVELQNIELQRREFKIQRRALDIQQKLKRLQKARASSNTGN